MNQIENCGDFYTCVFLGFWGVGNYVGRKPLQF